MTSADEKLRHRFSGERGMLVILSCTAFNCKCKFSTVREEQHGKFHAFLLLKRVSKIHTKHTRRFLVTAWKLLLVPCKTSPWQPLTLCSWENPYWLLCVPKQGKNQTKLPQTHRHCRGGGDTPLQKACLRQQTLTDWTAAWCDAGTPKAWADKWFGTQDWVMALNWFTHSWHRIPLLFCSSSAERHTLSVEKKQAVDRFSRFPVCGKNTCSEATDEMFRSKFETPSSISPANSMPRVEHLNNQG